jgi:hypothetical protein
LPDLRQQNFSLSEEEKRKIDSFRRAWITELRGGSGGLEGAPCRSSRRSRRGAGSSR